MGANLRGIPASWRMLERGESLKERLVLTFNSASVKPRPARARRLYLIVGHLTIGRSLSTGLGAIAAAFA